MKRLLLILLLVYPLASCTHSTPPSSAPETVTTFKAEDYSSFAAAVSAPETAGGTITVSSTHAIADDLVVPSDRSLSILTNGQLSVAGGKLLTLNGTFSAATALVFSGAGSIKFSGGNNRVIKPEWFGAVADGTTESAPAIIKAINSADTDYTVSLSSGTYRMTPALVDNVHGLVITGRSGLTLQGTGSDTVLKLTSQRTRVFELHATSNITFKQFTVYGTFESEGPLSMESVFFLGAQAGANDGVTWDHIDFRHCATTVIGAYSTTDGLQKNLRLTNINTYQTLALILASGIQGATLDNIYCDHRSTPPPDAPNAISQDEDVAFWSTSGVSNRNISVNNVTILSHGTPTNPYAGSPKLAFAIAEAGLVFDGLTVSNIVVQDNVSNGGVVLTYTYGTQTSSLYIIDGGNPLHDGFKNTSVSSMSLTNSMGLFLAARNLNISNITLDGFTPPATMPWYYGRAIDTNGTAPLDGTLLQNVVVKNWNNLNPIFTEVSSITLDQVTLENCPGSLWATDRGHYSNLTFINSGDATYGAMYLPYAASPNFRLSNSSFTNCPFVALKDNRTGATTGGTLENVTFSGNATNSDLSRLDTWTLINTTL